MKITSLNKMKIILGIVYLFLLSYFSEVILDEYNLKKDVYYILVMSILHFGGAYLFYKWIFKDNKENFKF